MINEIELLALGLTLESYQLGYYTITDKITVDVEGIVRRKHRYIGQVYNIEELKILITILQR